MLPIKTLPLVERWHCAGCARCCRGSLIWLEPDDLRKLDQQGWEQHREFAGSPIVVTEGWFGGRKRLAQRDDGSCVFLLPDGRCRIHAEYGPAAKPLACRMFPLQLVPWDRHAVLTLRRACPTAAADDGPELKEYRRAAADLAAAGCLPDRAVPPPLITRRKRGTWPEATAVAGSLERLLTDETYPLVRRLCHALRFCSLLEECQLGRLSPSQLTELCGVLVEAALEVGDVFRARAAPRSPAAVLFRQTIAEYLRVHPAFTPSSGWLARWRQARVAVAMARGRGRVPGAQLPFPSVEFEALEQPLGHLDEAIQRPWLRYFAAQAASRQYALASRPDWPLVESLRALVLGYPVGLWVLRWVSAGERPRGEQVIDLITMLDRGQGYAPLTSRAHRARVQTLARLGELERLVAWYAR